MSTHQAKWDEKEYNWLVIAIFIVISFFMIKGLINTYNFHHSIEENRFTTIAKVVKFEYGSRGSSRTHYVYYYHKKKYTTWDRKGSSNENCIGRFFLVNISTKEPENSVIELNHEITDSREIVNSGFK